LAFSIWEHFRGTQNKYHPKLRFVIFPIRPKPTPCQHARSTIDNLRPLGHTNHPERGLGPLLNPLWTENSSGIITFGLEQHFGGKTGLTGSNFADPKYYPFAMQLYGSRR